MTHTCNILGGCMLAAILVGSSLPDAVVAFGCAVIGLGFLLAAIGYVCGGRA